MCGKIQVPVVDITPSILALEDPSSVFLQQDRH